MLSRYGILCFLLQYLAKILHRKKIKFRVSSISKLQGEQVHILEVLRGDFLQTRVSSAQKSNESGSRLRNLGKVKMAGNFFIVRVFPGSIYKHNNCGLVPF